ncbi:MAG: protein kinase, partial [Symploca sp. SIO2E6]|nr:protein kinase [Symploca sp. SIO2E6]
LDSWSSANYPDFSSHDYQIKRQLGQNRLGGRSTYLATNIKTQQPVVIKQFQFAQPGASWKEYDAYESEIKLLKQLELPSIPRYLDSFETPSGFCLVQEYKKAPSLAQPRHFTPLEVKQIAIAVLEILVYLQQQRPTVIHRDIKPENILVDRSQRQIKAYLIDFGFARRGSKDLAASSVVKGTLGFMPPEQLFNRQLTKASDLYGLGLTIICLLTKTKSIEIGELVNDNYQINFKYLVPKLSREFIDWLSKMTSPSLKDRYPNAVFALKAIKNIDVVKIKPTQKLRIHFQNFYISFLDYIQKTLEAMDTSNSGIFSKGIANLRVIQGNLYTLVSQTPKTIKKIIVISLALILFTKTSATYYLHNRNFSQFIDTKTCIKCNLEGVNFKEIRLLGANLQGANLKKANLKDTILIGVNFKEANLEGVKLEDASLERANFVWSSLKNANLEGVNLRDARLDYANLKNANLEGANLKGAKLDHANLKNANLEGANLNNTSLSGTNLKNANLKNAHLKQVQLTTTKLEGAIMPNGLRYNSK